MSTDDKVRPVFDGLISSQRRLSPNEEIRVRREMLGFTQSQLGHDANVRREKLSLFENGLGDLTAAELARIKKVLAAVERKVTRVGLPANIALRSGGQQITNAVALRDRTRERMLRRLRLGMSLRELSRDSQIRLQKLSAFEDGKKELSEEEVSRWDAVLKRREREDPEFLKQMARELFDENHTLQSRVELLEQAGVLKDEIIKAKDGQLAAYEAQIKRMTDLLDIKTKEVLLRDEIESKARQEQES